MIRFRVFVLGVVFLALAGMAGAAHPVAAQSWQYSFQPSNQVGPTYRMGIRSKFGETTYWATFIVTHPDGRAFSRTIRVQGDAWGWLTYPQDFRAAPPAGQNSAGQYSYVIVVGGKIAISAKFKLR